MTYIPGSSSGSSSISTSSDVALSNPSLGHVLSYDSAIGKWKNSDTPNAFITAIQQSGGYTLALTDAGKVIEATSSTAANITVPGNTIVPFPVGTVIEVYQAGTGRISIVPAANVILIPSPGMSLVASGQGAAIKLRKRAAQTWAVTGDLLPVTGSDGFYEVSTAAQLHDALQTIKPGNTILLSDGIYSGRFVANVTASATQPITITGSRNAILDGGGTGSGYGLHVDRADWWTFRGFTVRNAKKGIMVDETKNATFDSLEVHTIGEEAVHLRNFSSNNLIKNCSIHDTGKFTPGFGEGLYIGQAKSNWTSSTSRTGGAADTSDNNQVLNTTVFATTAECIDIKEGTTGTVVRGSTLNGSGVKGENFADSWMDVKGNDAIIEGNTCTQTGGVFTNGLEIHTVLTGWGLRNIFRSNSLTNPIGYGIYVDSSVPADAGTVVELTNSVAGTNTGLTNIATSGDGGGGGATKVYPADHLNLTNWKLTLPINTSHAGEPDEIKQPELATFIDNSYFHLNSAKDAVVFTAHCGGYTTSNSGYPRSELREMTSNGTAHASWSTSSGSHEMTVTEMITHLPVVKPHVVAAQIHDSSDDVIMVRLEGSRLFVEGGGNELALMTSSYTLNTPFTVRLRATGGHIYVFYNGTQVLDLTKSTSGCYFKAGCYTQSNTSKGDAPTAYGQVVISSLTVTHS